MLLNLEPLRAQQVISRSFFSLPVQGLANDTFQLHKYFTSLNYLSTVRPIFPFLPVFRQLHVNKWDETEVQAIERHMMDFIKKHKVPQKNDCIKCLEAENEALRDRSWKGVKNYVRNRITTLQNAKKASKTVKRRCINEDGNGSDGGSNDNQSQHQDSAQLDDNEGEWITW